MSKKEIYAMMEKNPYISPSQAIENTDLPTHVVNKLAGKGISTIGALVDTDAFDTVTSGRYDIESIREVNGIPIAAFRLILDAVTPQSVAEPMPAI